MAVPKQKTPRSRRGKRRSHSAPDKPTLSECPKCKSKKLPHLACLECGFYNKQEVLKIETLQERRKRQEKRDSNVNK
jgi:large subunit ribosomal protein L32